MADVILNVEGTPLSGLATLVNWFSAAITWAGGLTQIVIRMTP